MCLKNKIIACLSALVILSGFAAAAAAQTAGSSCANTDCSAANTSFPCQCGGVYMPTSLVPYCCATGQVNGFASSNQAECKKYCGPSACVPKTCASLGNYTCGDWSDGCGLRPLHCGFCSNGQKCVAGKCVIPAIPSASCGNTAHVNSGVFSSWQTTKTFTDSCKKLNGTVTCIADIGAECFGANCVPPQLCTCDCNDSSVCAKQGETVYATGRICCAGLTPQAPGQCNNGQSSPTCTVISWKCLPAAATCVPKTCASLGNYTCGSWSDGCGNTTPSCGTCASGQACSNGSCASNCAKHASQKCDSDNLYWYNSCNAKEELAQNCGVGGLTTNYKCSGSWIQRETVTKSCSNNACASASAWANYTDCLDSGKTCSDGKCVALTVDQRNQLIAQLKIQIAALTAELAALTK